MKKKNNLSENDILGLLFIGLGVTFIALFSSLTGYSNITGMAVGNTTAAGDTSTMIIMVFVVMLTIATSFLAIHLMRTKSD